jgi:Zn ribbon nucleic-acid-binding protein
MTTCPKCSLVDLVATYDRSGQTAFRHCTICDYRDTVSERAPENRLRADDPARYLNLFARDPSQRANFVLYALNWYRERGTPMPVPAPAYDLLKAAGCDVSKMTPIKSKLIQENR